MRLLAALGVTFLLLACDSRSPTSPGPTAPAGPVQIHVTGRVIDFQTGQGAANRELVWTGSGAAPTVTDGFGRTITDGLGRYKVLLSPADRYTVAEGGVYAPTVIVPGTGYVTDFYVNVGYCRLWYGVVFDAQIRRPVAGARAAMSHSRAESITDQNGVFRVDIGCGEIPNWTGTTLYSVSRADYRTFSHTGGRAEWYRTSGFHVREDVLLVPVAP